MKHLRFVLNEIQLREVKASLAKLEAGHRARVAWFDDYSLEGHLLSIHALDLVTALSHCQRSPENEMELFRLRKAATDELALRREKTGDVIKKQNIGMWIESFRKLWPGTDADVDLTIAPPQPRRIELQ